MWQYRILGFILIYFFAITIKQDYEEILVRNRGKMISVIIIGKHQGGGRFSSYFLDFEFNGKNFDVKVPRRDYVNKVVGEKIYLLHVNGIDHFVNPSMSMGLDPIIGLIFLIAGLFFILYSPHKRK